MTKLSIKWAGADTDHFIKLEGNEIYLDQSYRVPRRVHDVAFKYSKPYKTQT